MAKLYFRYGSVGSAKTLNLLAVAHNYRQQNKKVLLMKPALDLRFGKAEIKSRAGLSIEADFLLDNNTRFFLGKKAISKKDCLKNSQIINLANYDDLACIVVDEAQFLNSETIEALHTITISHKVPVIAYGLKTDFKGFLFEGSKRLLELSDTIEEIKTTCFYCNKKATYNLKFVNNKAIFEGETIDLGAEEKYKPVCKYCFYDQMKH